ncbi:unnamed protein product [Amoebophrya sp. A120]|nr:unnamed protein product [Amoebophrya sp. A120]|eukprot:GSA120T00005670001.1
MSRRRVFRSAEAAGRALGFGRYHSSPRRRPLRLTRAIPGLPFPLWREIYHLHRRRIAVYVFGRTCTDVGQGSIHFYEMRLIGLGQPGRQMKNVLSQEKARRPGALPCFAAAGVRVSSAARHIAGLWVPGLCRPLSSMAARSEAGEYAGARHRSRALPSFRPEGGAIARPRPVAPGNRERSRLGIVVGRGSRWPTARRRERGPFGALWPGVVQLVRSRFPSMRVAALGRVPAPPAAAPHRRAIHSHKAAPPG